MLVHELLENIEISSQGYLKLLKNESFSLKIDCLSWNLLRFTDYFVHSSKNAKAK